MRWDRAKEIVTLLNPKTSTFEIRVQGLQGGLTGHDVAMALSGAPSIQRHIIDAITLDAGNGSEIIAWWFKGVAVRLSDINRWHKCNHAQKMSIADIAYKEACLSKRCDDCKGRKEVPDMGGIMYPCETCNGKGFINLSDKEKAKIIGVHPTSYSRTWKPREDQCVMVFDTNYVEAIDRIVQKLKEKA